MPVKWTRGARTDLLELVWHIAQDRPDAARGIADRIKAATQRLGAQPMMGRIVPEFSDPRLREVMVHPYRIVYLQSGALVKVLGIVHGRRTLPDLSHR